ncbi:hypothetical protein P153DRAFT_369184 [Dothidotthia symphoricarpi CBS 119687]|uniref:XPG-I domain-containing protein n=1 Tax=Dothidotthia symphoricarpi CBS 119687 TaxID=1392245 RepID=A0A6A6A377_9PLEO|nr:uncharacterized protein P153DRAFT_369184 [Dothidotthia symphoricarpi CBS 119687]KAF2126472.1 hypothetical protein P153DRAFT_369184 [Dothidotthia symphoricarpi CBS 119687]
MGIPQLFNIIRDRKIEKVVSIAQLAEDHHKQHGRPLRIAIDEADFRFHNLTQAEVDIIRKKTPAANPIEKAMFYRMCRLLTLHIQPVIVFDGPHRPLKRRKRYCAKIDYDKRQLLKDMLTCLGIPHHEAPAEAEAECARLQILGLVDAVWSQDSDCLMFGCTFWLRDDRVAKEKGNNNRSKGNTKKNSGTARVVKARDLGLSRESLVLFAILVGGDYNIKGLPRCGVVLAMRALKHGGLARNLCSCRDQKDCDAWSIQLAEFIESLPGARSVPIPAGYPSYETLQKYYRPTVSSDEDLRNNARLNLEHVWLFKELELLKLTSSRFNIWGDKYMNWIVPILLTRHLSKRDTSLPREVLASIEVNTPEKQRIEREFERKVSFSPFGVTSLQREYFESRRGSWDGKRYGVRFDPNHEVVCEFMPEYWLQKGLPLEIFDPPRTPKRKSPDPTTGTSRPAKKQRNPQKPAKRTESAVTRASPSHNHTKPSQGSNLSVSPTKEHSQQPPSHGPRKGTGLPDSEKDDPELRPPPKTLSRTLSSIQSAVSNVVESSSPDDQEGVGDSFEDVGAHNKIPNSSKSLKRLPLHDWPDEEDDADLQLALQLSLQEQQPVAGPSARKPTHHTGGSVWEEVEDNAQSLFVSDESPPVVSYQQVQTGVLQGQHSSAGRNDTTRVAPPDFSKTSERTVRTTPKNSRLSDTDVAESSATGIRAARLRHFGSSSAVSPKEVTHKPQPLPVMTPRKLNLTPSRVPVGVECIDLTFD